MGWQSEAACRSYPIDYFFHNEAEVVTDSVRELCTACSVRDNCLQLAIATDSIGIWAATTTEERRKMRPKRVMVAEHGTTSGHHRHLKRGEKPCDSCRLARLEYLRKYRTQRRANGLRVS
jgi:Transcription factor WhiB